MSEYDDQETLVIQLEDDQQPTSLMEQLRAKRQEVAETRETGIPIPMYAQFNIQARYRLLERQETDTIAKRVRKQTNSRDEFMSLSMMDILIAAVESFTYGMEETPLRMDANGNGRDDGDLITSWGGLARFLGAEGVEREREALLYVFCGNEFAISQQALLLNRWFTNTGAEINEEFLGELV